MCAGLAEGKGEADRPADAPEDDVSALSSSGPGSAPAGMCMNRWRPGAPV